MRPGAALGWLLLVACEAATKPPPVQERPAPPQDCARLPGRIEMGHSFDETREDNAAMIELCTKTPWPDAVIHCVLTTKDPYPQHCLDDLPAEMKATYDARMLAVYKNHNDYIGPELRPQMPSAGSGSDSELDLLDQ